MWGEHAVPTYLEPLAIEKGANFVMIGERTNVTGSKKFANLIKAGDYTSGLQIAVEQVRSGALQITKKNENSVVGPYRCVGRLFGTSAVPVLKP